MGKDPKFELKQHLNDKANTSVRCIVKAVGEARKEACIEHVFPSVESQEAKINATQKVCGVMLLGASIISIPNKPSCKCKPYYANHLGFVQSPCHCHAAGRRSQRVEYPS